MKKLYFVFFIAFCFTSIKSQFNCGFNDAQNYLFNYDKTAKDRFEKLMKEAQNSAQQINRPSSVTNYTIPVVFHVLHLAGNENISDAQINNAVSIMNRDFLKQNADTSNIVSQFTNLAANCNIEFRLATKDPYGNCTNGITRHYDSHTNWTVDFSYYTYTWPSTQYLNIYVVKTMQAGAAGYTYLPGSVGASADAIVVLSQYVGSIGTGNTFVSRTLTHEVGHWLNLQHVWGSTNQPNVACGNDGVNDTPITKGHTNCNLGNAITCTSGITENIQNYMEYSYCTNMFTIDQKTRMQNAINNTVGGRNNLWTNTNLITTGVINPNMACAPKAEFFSTTTITCLGNSLNFIDYSYNAPISNWKWSSAFASTTSTLQNGSLTFTNSGIAPIQLKVSNGAGSDSIIKSSVIILAASGTGSFNITKDFETGSFPDNNWIVSLPKYGSTFTTFSTSASSGSACIWVNNFFDNPSEVISFYSPSYNLQTLGAHLTFKYAYTQQNTLNNDALKIYATTNCGATWTLLFNKSGSVLNSTGNIQTAAFLNPIAADWKNETVNLASALGSANVYFKFEFTSDVNGSGNNIFIDDINVDNTVGLKELINKDYNLKIHPNPVNEIVNIELKTTNSALINSITNIQISNTLGQLVYQSTIPNQQGFQINVSNLKSGIYFVTVFVNNSNKTFKLIKN